MRNIQNRIQLCDGIRSKGGSWILTSCLKCIGKKQKINQNYILFIISPNILSHQRRNNKHITIPCQKYDLNCRNQQLPDRRHPQNKKGTFTQRQKWDLNCRSQQRQNRPDKKDTIIPYPRYDLSSLSQQRHGQFKVHICHHRQNKKDTSTPCQRFDLNYPNQQLQDQFKAHIYHQPHNRYVEHDRL